MKNLKFILPILDKLRANQTLTKEEEIIKNKFIIDDEHGNYRTNLKSQSEYIMSKGIRILVSNTISNPVEAWIAYYERERVEDAFKITKQIIGGNRYRNAKNETTEGKTFVMFLATAIGLMFRQRVKNASLKDVKIPYDSDNKILANLNSIEQTLFKYDGYYSAVTGVHKRILDAIDVPIPVNEIFGKLSDEEKEIDEDDNLRNLDELEIMLQ